MTPDTSSSFHDVETVLRRHNSFVIAAHMRPDGDAIGSTIAMGEALKQLGKKVILINESGIPQNLSFMKGCEQIIQPSKNTIDADVLISLDNGSWKRLGKQTIEAVKNIPLCLNIDHHETNDRYGDINCVMPEECSTGALLYDLFKYMNLPFSSTIRDAIYIAISTDTGSFQYERTTPKVMEMAADLIRLGTNVHEINRKLYQESSWNKLIAVREVLNNMHLAANNKISYSLLTTQRKKELGIHEEDTEGLIDILRSIRGTVLSAFFEEQEDGRVRISLRSKDQNIPINNIAASFGGGGHALASGVRMKTTMEDARHQILKAMEKALADNP